MITHCKKCDINWARLWSEDGEGDEQYEVCPVCKSDLNLESGTDIVSYIMCPITGRITDMETGELHPRQAAPVKVYTARKIKVWDESYEEFKNRQDKAQDDLIDRYASLKGAMSDSEAYKKACEEMEAPKRKYHFEEI
jgi:hypothetical protein